MDSIRRPILATLALVLAVAAWGATAAADQAARAIWPLAEGRLAVVGEGAGPAALPAGAVSFTTPAGTYGVILPQHAAAALGLPKAPAPAASALLLQHRWQLNGQVLARHTVTVAGQRWQVGLTQARQRAGLAWQGVVQPDPQTAALKAPPIPQAAAASQDVTRLVTIEPAAGLAPTVQPAVAEELLPQAAAALPAGFRTWRGLQLAYQPGTVAPLPPPQAAPLPSMPLAESAPMDPVLPEAVTATAVTATVLDAAAISATLVLAEEPPSATQPPLTTALLLPPRGADFFTDLTEAQRAVQEAPAGSTAEREARLALAGTYVAWQRPEEAQAVLGTLARRADGLPQAPLPRLLAGVAALARGEAPPPAAFDQPGALAPHAALWAAVAAVQQGAYATALGAWPTQRGLLPAYPAYLRALAQQAQIEALVMTGQNAAALQALESLAASYPDHALPSALRYWRGLARLGTAVVTEGLEDLAAAAEDPTNPAIAMRAKLEFVLALHRRRELSDTQLRGHLEDLQHDWRGDALEQRTLSILADLYDKLQQPNRALKTWQTLVQAFPRNPEVPLLTERMAQALVRVFDLEDNQTYDDLAYVGLYYDFRELLPNDERGDLVQERIAELLLQANLFERAVPLLEQQLKFRPLEPLARGRQTLLLARAYGQLNRPEDALRLLDANRPLANTQTLRRGWALAEARALLALNRPAAAANALAPLLEPGVPEDREARQLAAEAAWQGQQWAQAEQQLGALLAPVPVAILVSQTAAQLNVFRLAYALAKQGKGAELTALKNRYREAWPALPRLADDVNAVAVSSGVTGLPPEGGPLEPLTTALGGLNSLDAQVANLRRELDRSRSSREEYNRRMEYMELLPPPAL